jgi:hypothetical protein
MRRFYNSRPAALLTVVLAAALFACSEDETPTDIEKPNYVVERRVMRDIDFVKNRYYLFIHPAPSLNGVFRPAPFDTLLPDDSDPATKEIQVWQSVTAPEIAVHPEWDVRWANAFVDMLDDGFHLNLYADSIAAGHSLPGEFQPRQFRLLEQYVDYELMVAPYDFGLVVGFVLRTPVANDRSLAVRYTNLLGERIGGTYADYGIGAAQAVTDPDRDMILKLIKAPNQLPEGPTGFVWHYMMRNFYNLGLTWISPNQMSLEIRDRSMRADPTRPEGSTVPYIRIFGLDRYNLAGELDPDGLADVHSPYVVDHTNGILMFPSLMPFAPDSVMVREWTDGEFSFADSLYVGQYEKSRRMYMKYLSNPVADAYQYDIFIKVTRPE